jgi:hypothetical protein
MKMIVKILDQYVNLLKVEINQDYLKSFYYKLTFDNEYIFYCCYRCGYKYWDFDDYNDGKNEYQPTTLQELPDIQKLAKLIETQAKKEIAITSCIELIDGGYGNVLSKCVLFGNIEKYYQITFNVLSKTVNTSYTIKKDDLIFKTRFEQKYNEYTSKFIKIDVKKLLKGKDGLGVNTKQFCKVMIHIAI